ncbi:MAG: tyrosinase family protein [Oxalobacteraceae bacterium]|nr:MAG: tyrosinase family protein [Oxalobacteraceae bacterium]
MTMLTGRRNFLRNSGLVLGMPALAGQVFAQSSLQRRLEWQAFKVTTQYDSLLTAITRMKANTNAADPNSWSYWTNIHVQQCPHNIPYFLAWHRGYLYHFERRLRQVSGNGSLVLPYWDYYTYASVPAEFTNANSSNPLYADRVNTNIRQALTLAPFSPTVISFPRGSINAFEPSLEGAPHNPVHDIMGGLMATMQSPLDPIFWLHHANVDRLWVAWVAAGGARRMPGIKNAYWSGNHIYTSTLTMQRKLTYDNRSSLQYYYQNESMPTSMPVAQVPAAQTFRVQADLSKGTGPLPPVGTFTISGARATGDSTFSIGGARSIGLDERSITAQLPVSSQHWNAVQEIMRGNAASLPGSTKRYQSVFLVVDGVELSNVARKGGFYYQVYLNLPAANGTSGSPASILVGTLGAFQIAGASHHAHQGVQLRFPLGRKLAKATALQIGMASVSFVRVSGDNSPKGPAIGIGEVRLELSTDDVQS